MVESGPFSHSACEQANGKRSVSAPEFPLLPGSMDPVFVPGRPGPMCALPYSGDLLPSSGPGH